MDAGRTGAARPSLIPATGASPLNDTKVIVAVTLLAVLVGAALPVCYQLLQTLRSARRFLDRNGLRLERTLDQLTATNQRIEKLGAELEDGVKGLKPAVTAASDLGQSLNQMRDSLRLTAAVAGAVGPVLVSALRAMRGPADDAAGAARKGKRKAGDAAEGKENEEEPVASIHRARKEG